MNLADALHLRRLDLREAERRRTACRILRSMLGGARNGAEDEIYREIGEATRKLVEDPGLPAVTAREWKLILSGFVLPLLISGPEYYARSSKRGETLDEECEALRSVALRWGRCSSRHERVRDARDALLALVELLPSLASGEEKSRDEAGRVVNEFAVQFLPLLACMRMKELGVCLRPRLVANGEESVSCD